ncbi:unnamed protein product [Chrysoparadoxa australica]
MVISAEVGTPAQRFRLKLDSTHTYMWIGECVESEGCLRHSRYIPTLSATSIPLGIYDAEVKPGLYGTLWQENMVLAGHATPHQNFCSVDKGVMSDDLYEMMVYDGSLPIMFGFEGESLHKTILSALHDQGVIGQEIAGVYMAKLPHSFGELLIGGWAPERCTHPPTWHARMEIEGFTGWSFLGTHVTYVHEVLGRENAFLGNPRRGQETAEDVDERDPILVTIALGSPVITGPVDVVNGILDSMEEDRPAFGDVVRCGDDRAARWPRLEFRIGDEEYFLDGNDYLIPVDNGFCFVALHGDDFEDFEHGMWVLGTPFVRKYYSILNHKDDTIGLCHANHTHDDELPEQFDDSPSESVDSDDVGSSASQPQKSVVTGGEVEGVGDGDNVSVD